MQKNVMSASAFPLIPKSCRVNVLSLSNVYNVSDLVLDDLKSSWS